MYTLPTTSQTYYLKVSLNNDKTWLCVLKLCPTPTCVCVISYPRLQVFECVCEDDVEDGVWSTALLVHVGSSDSPRLIPLWHQRLNVLSEQQKANNK